MLQAFIITLREGVEAALIVGIVLAYLAKIGRPDLRKAVYGALGAAFVVSIAAAVAIAHTSFNQDVLEGWIMLAAAAFVVSMIVFMARTARFLKARIQDRVRALAGAGSRAGLFLFVFLMVVREGIETVLVLSAVSLNSSELLSVIGTMLGVAASVLFGVMFIKGSVRINLQKFFRITTVILIFVAAQLTISGLHELFETGVLPSSREEMALIGPIVRNDLFFFITILALAALMVLFEQRRRAPAATPESPAERRKAQWSARRERLWMGSVYASSFVFIVLVTAQFIYTKSASAAPPATRVAFDAGRIVVPIAQIADDDLHRYAVTINGTEVRFFLYRKPDGKVATVFDACEVCGPVGFTRGSNGLVCKNCAAPINGQSVGQAGGCNPIPLKASVEGENVVITQAALAEGVAQFQRQ